MNATALRTRIQESLRHRTDVNLTLREKTTPEVLPSGIPGIDIPRGTLTEIYGPTSSGRTSLLTGVLARATQRPEFCALIDGSNAFDPGAAANVGMRLEQLLWIRCGGSAEHALRATDLIVQGGGFGIVALDLCDIPARDARRISLASWFRLRNAVEKTSTALIVVEKELNAHSCSLLQIETRPAGFQIRETLLRELSVNAQLGPRRRANASFTLQPVYWE